MGAVLRPAAKIVKSWVARKRAGRPSIAARTLLCLALAASTAPVMAASSANFTLAPSAVNNGVAGMSSASYRLDSSVGEGFATGSITSVSFVLKNGFRAQVNASPAVLTLLSVVSRKFHGAVPFSLPISNYMLPLSGAISVEPREIGGGHTLVFHFDGAVNAVAAASALDAAMNSAATVSFVRSGNDVIVTLVNVADNTRLLLTLTGVNSSVTVSASIGFLVGDVSSSRTVNAADISAVKANFTSLLTSSNYRFDLNGDGVIDQTDVNAARARSGRVIP